MGHKILDLIGCPQSGQTLEFIGLSLAGNNLWPSLPSLTVGDLGINSNCFLTYLKGTVGVN